MSLGYDGKLYILAFDHRGSFTKRFGVEGEPTPDDLQRFSDGKLLIFEGIEAALEKGADPAVTGCLVDEQFGGPTEVPQKAKPAGSSSRCPSRRAAKRSSTSSTETTSELTSSASTPTSRRCSSATTRMATPR